MISQPALFDLVERGQGMAPAAPPAQNGEQRPPPAITLDGTLRAPCGCHGHLLAKGKGIVHLKVTQPCALILRPADPRSADACAILHLPPESVRPANAPQAEGI